jgi:hypothetical protein
MPIWNDAGLRNVYLGDADLRGAFLGGADLRNAGRLGIGSALPRGRAPSCCPWAG